MRKYWINLEYFGINALNYAVSAAEHVYRVGKFVSFQLGGSDRETNLDKITKHTMKLLKQSPEICYEYLNPGPF
jgi:predicted heme/steroid binding protein